MKPVLLLILCVALFRCAPSDTKQANAPTPVEQAESDVMALHDTVMTRMGALMKAKKQLRQRIARLDSLTGSPTEAARATEQKAEAQRVLARVDEADMGMMSWMQNYNGDTLKVLPAADALRYLAAEKTKITDVNQKINTSLAQSNAFLGQ